MRKRELIAKLKDDWREIRKTQTTWNGNAIHTQVNEARRLMLLHHLEALLPEIIEKMEA